MLRDRQDAGARLALELAAYKSRPDCLVMGLPRGGVVVAHEIARALELPLEACIVRKLGAPAEPELAMGALAGENITVLNDEVIRAGRITPEEIQAEIAEERKELARRDLEYRGGRPFPIVRGKTVILVDDGIATGSTMEAAIQVLRQQGAAAIIVAAGVAAPDTARRLARIATRVVCAVTPPDLRAIGCWFEDFEQVSDEQVRELLSSR